MMQVSILRLLLLFVGHVNQKIETMRFQIAGDNRQELLFMKQQQFLHGFAKQIQQTALLGANPQVRLYVVRPIDLHTRLAQTSTSTESNRPTIRRRVVTVITQSP